jgi:hypothetical protein
VPLATVAATFAVNVSTTLPPPGIVKTPHVGTVSPTVGFVVEVLVAWPFKVTVPVELKVKPVGRVYEIFKFMADPVGAVGDSHGVGGSRSRRVLGDSGSARALRSSQHRMHCAPEPAPGTSVKNRQNISDSNRTVAPYAVYWS